MTSSDLASCYDRIVHTVAALALLRTGIPKTKVTSMFSTILFGDSKETYGGDTIGE